MDKLMQPVNQSGPGSLKMTQVPFSNSTHDLPRPLMFARHAAISSAPSTENSSDAYRQQSPGWRKRFGEVKRAPPPTRHALLC